LDPRREFVNDPPVALIHERHGCTLDRAATVSVRSTLSLASHNAGLGDVRWVEKHWPPWM